eukprot:m.123555 g.123555  ORF g.123555 m.123555 type:complete len:335 (+) comp28996_c0_seq1:423-1427(+)
MDNIKPKSGGVHSKTTLRNGLSMPTRIYGTYKVGAIPTTSTRATSVGRPTKDVILDAISVGYRNFDCAGNYENEKGVGAALLASGVPRSELFLCSKLRQGCVYEGPTAVRRDVEKTLKDLGTTYVDLFYIHWPVPADSVGQIPRHVVAYKELEKLCNEGKIKSLGISNYTMQDYADLKQHMTIAPVCNQFEVSVFMYRKNTIRFFEDNGLKIVAYRALKQGDELNNKTLQSIAQKHGVSVPQVLLRWQIEHNLSFVARTQQKKHMENNLDLDRFRLDESDLMTLDNMTSPNAIEEFKAKYEDCICRETPFVGKLCETGFIGWATDDDTVGHIAD